MGECGEATGRPIFMMTRILRAALCCVALACAGKTPPPAQPAPPPPAAPHACAEQCERELHECVGNTVESDQAACMFDNDECVTACFDVV